MIDYTKAPERSFTVSTKEELLAAVETSLDHVETIIIDFKGSDASLTLRPEIIPHRCGAYINWEVHNKRVTKIRNKFRRVVVKDLFPELWEVIE